MMVGKLLKNKVIYITGVGQGIGYECAKAYAREGAHVIVSDIDFESARATVGELPVEGFAIECDVAKGSSVKAAVE